VSFDDRMYQFASRHRVEASSFMKDSSCIMLAKKKTEMDLSSIAVPKTVG